MSKLDFGANLTREQQSAIDKEYAEKRRNERLGNTGEKGKESINVKALPGAKATAAAQEFVPGPATQKYLQNPVPKQADVEKELKEKAKLLRIYVAYYESDETAPYLPKRLDLSVRNSLPEIKIALDNVRSALNGANSDSTIRKLYPSLVELITKALAELGVLGTIGIEGNPAGVGAALTQAMDSPMLQTEMAEMAIELQDWFSASWSTRLFIKTFLFTKAYAAANAARTKPAPAMTPAQAAALSEDA